MKALLIKLKEALANAMGAKMVSIPVTPKKKERKEKKYLTRRIK